MEEMSKILKFLFIILAVKLFSMQFVTDEIYYRYTMEEFIQMHGYPFESYFVTTADGYILNLHRIPHGKYTKTEGKVVILVHGFWTSSMLWSFAGPNSSIAFMLADAGYDVWMPNFRGNEYSRNHTVLDPDKDSQFWDFSWHEMALNDLPASIDFILQQTNRSDLYLSGISEGTTEMYVLLSMLPEYNKKIKLYVHMAPVAFLGNTKTTFLTYPAAIMRYTKNMGLMVEWREMFAGRGSLPETLEQICKSNLGKYVCEKMYFTLGGYSINATNTSLFPTGIGQAISGGSSKNYAHYIQLAESGHFCPYDYGPEQNMLKYGQSTPPDYDLSKVTAPGYIIYASDDYLSNNSTDVLRLYHSLGNCLGKILVPFSFNHIDFLLGYNAPSFVYATVIKLFSQYQD